MPWWRAMHQVTMGKYMSTNKRPSILVCLLGLTWIIITLPVFYLKHKTQLSKAKANENLQARWLRHQFFRTLRYCLGNLSQPQLWMDCQSPFFRQPKRLALPILKTQTRHRRANMAPQTPIALESECLKTFPIAPNHPLATAAAVIIKEMMAAQYRHATISGVVLNNGISIVQCVLPANSNDADAIDLQQWLHEYHHQEPTT